MRSHKKVLVFGTFDELHAGHCFFLREARKQGDYLIAVLAQDETVKKLKGRPPRVPLAGRLAALRASGLADEVCAGDKIIGTWSSIKKNKPDIIALGYDQDALGNALGEFIRRKRLPIALVRLPATDSKRTHSHFLSQE